MEKKYVIGIEGTAHTVGIGIVDWNYKILANVYKMYTSPMGGIHPKEAANFHSANIIPLLENALKVANIEYSDVKLIGFSQGPGLGPSLRTVATCARALALCLKIPIVGVNHCVAHLEIGRGTTSAKNPILLYVSGGNTQIIGFANKKYRVFGETLDIGVGNMLDKFGRALHIPFPCGSHIEKLAEKGTNLLPLPYSVKGMDVAFSGILTSAINLLKKHSPEDVCYSLQETVFAMLTEVTERAMAHIGTEEVLLSGGVASNKRLRKMLSVMCEERGAEFYVPEREYCMDNGAMIAYTALLMYKSGVRMKIEDTAINQKFRTDDVNVTWR